jgi:hypothetical protein
VVAFVGSLILTFVMLAGVYWYAQRRPVGAPLSWGEAMMSATFMFFLAFWAYGVVPHQWLTYADNELNWRSDAILIGPGATFFTDFPVAVNKQVVRDLIAVAIYGIFLGAHVWLGSMWQNRAKVRAAKAAQLEAGTTTSYGRPLVKGS